MIFFKTRVFKLTMLSLKWFSFFRNTTHPILIQERFLNVVSNVIVNMLFELWLRLTWGKWNFQNLNLGLFSKKIIYKFYRCNTCGEYIYKGKKFNARRETVEDSDYLGLSLFRFYIRCPGCLAEITFTVCNE